MRIRGPCHKTVEPRKVHIAEPVFLSQLVKGPKENNIDLDSAAKGTHKGPIPNKTADPIKYITPLVQCLIDEIKSKEPVQSSFEQVQKLDTTEEQLGKAQQKLRQHGIQATPQRNTSSTPALPTESQDQATASQPSDTPADTQEAEPTQPPVKKARIAKTKADKADKQDKMDLPTILHLTLMTLQDNHPSSHTDTKVTQWMDSIKDKKFHTYAKKVVDMLSGISRKDRPNLVETAIRYGVPMDKVQQMSYKSLSQVVAAGAYFAI